MRKLFMVKQAGQPGSKAVSASSALPREYMPICPVSPLFFRHMPVRGKMVHTPRCALASLMRSVIDSAAYPQSMPSSRSRCFRQLPEPLVLRHLTSLPPALQLLQPELIRGRPLGSKSSRRKLLFTARIAAAPSSSSRAWPQTLAPDLAHLLTHKAI